MLLLNCDWGHIMYIVTKGGHKLSVDDSSIDYENEFFPFTQNVGMYSDATVLKPVWLILGI